MKGKSLRKHSLHEKIAASVLLKLFISSNPYMHYMVNAFVYLGKVNAATVTVYISFG